MFDTSFIFHLDDVLLPDQTSTSAQKDLNSVIFRYASIFLFKLAQLRKIYQYYCTLNVPAAEEGRNVITRSVLWKLMKDINLTQKGVTLGN